MLNRRKIKGLNLIEIILAIIIIGIVATLAIVRYGPSKEQVYDMEAQENLRLIQAAEKLYRTRFTNIYYPNVGNQSNTATINSFLKLDLPTLTSRWNYRVYFTGCVRATRNTGPVRYWHMDITDNEPAAGLGCP